MNHVEAVKTLAIERYLLEEMTQEERDAFEEHYFSCAECGEDARHAATMREGVRSGLADEGSSVGAGERARVLPLPLRPAASGWRSSVVLPWAAAALLASACYQTSKAAAGAPSSGSVRWLHRRCVRRAVARGRSVPGPGGIVTPAVDLGAPLIAIRTSSARRRQ